MRARRSCLSVPGSNTKMLAKAAGVAADEVFFDLEDSVPPADKETARRNVIEAVSEYEYVAPTKVLRVNAVDTKWCAGDITEVVGAVGDILDCVMIPKAQTAFDVTFVDNLLRMVEDTAGISHRLGIEVQIESAVGIENLREITVASDRLEDLILGPVDMSASLGLPMSSIGDDSQPLTHVLMLLNVAARARGLQCIDAPYLMVRDLDGLRTSAERARGLGFDGKWALHPDQVPVLNEVFSPSQDEYDHAEALLEHFRHAVEVEGRGAVMFGREFIDEATRKMAEEAAARGQAAGMSRTKSVDDYHGAGA